MHQYVPVRLQIFCKCLKARDLRESPVKETSPIFPSFALSLAPLKLMGAACGAPCTDNLDAFNRACIEQIQYSRQLRHTEQEMVFTHRLEDSLKRSMRTRRWISDDGTGEELDRLSRELFLLQDLDGDGLLGEDELVQINLTIAVLHHGDGADLVKVEDAYRAMFREKLNPDGQAIQFGCFRKHLRGVLNTLDTDVLAQKMILEQFVAEAAVAREVRSQELEALHQSGLTFMC
ncbi:unnamed protein product [Symbiodinium sp. KB8]|nr:unnamed protein product [Symbiodinium sp. KB8]